MNNNRTLTIVLVIVIAAVVVATGWYLTKPTDNSADFKGEWKATESYIYEMGGGHSVTTADDPDIAVLDITIDTAANNVMNLKFLEMTFVGVYQGDDIWASYANDSFSYNVYGHYGGNYINLTYIIQAQAITMVNSILYTHDRVMPDTGEPDPIDTMEWTMFYGSIYNGSETELSGTEFIYTDFNGPTFIGTMEQVVGSEVVKKTVIGSAIEARSGDKYDLKLLDDTGLIWNVCLEDGVQQILSSESGSEVTGSQGNMSSAVRYYSPDGTGEPVEVVTDLENTEWKYENGYGIDVNGNIAYSDEYDYSIHITGQNDRQLIGYAEESGYYAYFAATIMGSPTSTTPTLLFTEDFGNLFDYGFLKMSSDGKTLTYCCMYQSSDGEMYAECGTLVKVENELSYLVDDWQCMRSSGVTADGEIVNNERETDGLEEFDITVDKVEGDMIVFEYRGSICVAVLLNNSLAFETTVAGTDNVSVKGTFIPIGDTEFILQTVESILDSKGNVTGVESWCNQYTLGGDYSDLEFADYTGTYLADSAVTYNGTVYQLDGNKVIIEKQGNGVVYGTFQQTVGTDIVDKYFCGVFSSGPSPSIGLAVDETGNAWVIAYFEGRLDFVSFMNSELSEIEGDFVVVERTYVAEDSSAEVPAADAADVTGEWTGDNTLFVMKSNIPIIISGFTVDIEHQDNNLISGTISFGGGPELEFRGLVIGAEDPVIQFGIRDIQGNIISGVMVCNGSAITMNLVLNHNSSSLGLITTLYFEE